MLPVCYSVSIALLYFVLLIHQLFHQVFFVIVGLFWMEMLLSVKVFGCKAIAECLICFCNSQLKYKHIL